MPACVWHLFFYQVLDLFLLVPGSSSLHSGLVNCTCYKHLSPPPRAALLDIFLKLFDKHMLFLNLFFILRLVGLQSDSVTHIHIAILLRHLSLLVITQYGAEFSVLYSRYLLVLYLYIVMNLWCWRRLLQVPWTARISNWSILKEINPQYSLEGLMLKLQYFGHLM